MKTLALSLAGLFTARAAFNFVKDLVNDASALKDLGQQTHINVEELQRLAGAMSEFGIDADTLGKGLFTLSRKIAGGDESVARALHVMGLSIQDVEGLEGRELFLKMEQALAMLQGSLRDTTASDLFGSRLGAAMAGASEGIDGAVAAAAHMTVQSRETIDQLDKFGEAIERANKNLHNIAANLIGPVAEGFNVLIDAARKGASTWDIFIAMFKDMNASSLGVGASASNVATLLDRLNQTAERGKDIALESAKANAVVTVTLTEQQRVAQFMAALEKDAAGVLDANQVKNLKHLKEIGALNVQNAAAIGVNGAQFAKYTEGLDALVRVETAMVATYENKIRVLDRATTASLAHYGFGGQIAALIQLDAAEKAHTEAILKSLTDEQRRADVIQGASERHLELLNQQAIVQEKQAGIVNAAVIAEFDAQVKLNQAQGLDAAGAIAVQLSALDKMRIALQDLHLLAVDGISQKAQEQVITAAYTQALYDEAVALDATFAAQLRANEETAKVPAVAAAAAQSIVTIGTAIAFTLRQAEAWNALMAATVNVGTMAGSSGVTGAGNGGVGNLAMITDWVRAILQQAAASGISVSGGPGMQGRAEGGPVSRDIPYRVGERGPEVFVPRTAGSILPTSGWHQNTTIQVYVTQPLGTPETIARVVGDALMTRLRMQGQRFPSGV